MLLQGVKGPAADTTTDNELLTNSVSRTNLEKNNEKGNLWVIEGEISPVAEGIFFYLLNTDDEILTLKGLKVVSSTANNVIELIQVNSVGIQVNPPVGTDTQVTNRTVESTKNPNIISRMSTDFSSLIESGVLSFKNCTISAQDYEIEVEGNILIPQGKLIAIKSSSAATVRVMALITRG